MAQLFKKASLKVKNTFLELESEDLEEGDDGRQRRCTSAPPVCRSQFSDLELLVASKELCEGTAASETTGEDADACSVCSLCTSSSEAWRPEEISTISTISAQAVPFFPASAAPLDASGAFRLLALAACSALAACGQAEVQPSCFGYRVVLKLPRETMGYRASFLLAAQQAVLKAAQNSSATYVLGYRGTPFLQTPVGFSALMCHVPDASRACWDLLQWGSCDFGDTCRWEHPAARATLNVMVALLE